MKKDLRLFPISGNLVFHSPHEQSDNLDENVNQIQEDDNDQVQTEDSNHGNLEYFSDVVI